MKGIGLINAYTRPSIQTGNILSKIKSPIPGLVNISKFGLDRQLFVFDTYLPSDG